MSTLVHVHRLLFELRNLDHGEIRPTWVSGVGDELDVLRRNLDRIGSVLLDAEEKKGKVKSIKDWLVKVRSVCYDVDELLEELSPESSFRRRRKTEKRYEMKVPNETSYPIEMQHKIKLIRERCDDIESERNRLPLINSIKRDSTSQSVVGTASVFGRDEERKHVTQLLLGEQNTKKNVSFISIVGRTGMGTTTLAQVVYNSGEVRDHFELMIWVCLSGGQGPERICKDIISSVTGKQSDNKHEMGAVAYKLKTVLDGRKFLLVLDETWITEPIEWMEVEELLSAGAKGSKVLITTLGESDAPAATAIYHLKKLSRDASWALFSEFAFEQRQLPESAIVEIGKQIVEKCRGVPRSIKSVGRILRLMKNVSDWLEFQKYDLALIITLNTFLLEFDRTFVPTPEMKKATIVTADQPENQRPLDENDPFKFQKNDLPQIVGPDRISVGSDSTDTDQTFELTLETEGTIVVTADQTENQIPLDSTDRNIDPIHTLEVSVDGRRRASFLNLKLQIFHFSHLPDIPKGQRFEGALFYSDDYLISMEEKAQSGGKQVMVEMIQDTFSKEEAGPSSSILPKKINDISMWEHVVLGISEAEDAAPAVQSKEVVMIKISSLPDNPTFPNLTILLLQKDKSLRKLDDSFFANMPSLHVLDLSETGLRSLPSSLFKLTALEALLLRDCNNLDNLQADICNLGNLKVLDVKGTELYNLPEEVNNLTKLEFLRVSFYGAYDPSEYSTLPPQLIPTSTISNLPLLKALSIIVHPSDWRWNNQADAMTDEVGSLCELTYLQFCFTEVRLVELFMKISPSWKKNALRKFKFIVGQDIDRIVCRVPEKVVSEFDRHDRCLRYVNGNEIPGGFAGLLVRVTAFYLDHHCVTKNLSEFGHENFMELEFCVVRECPNVVEIVDNSERSDSVVLPNIQHLSLHYLWKLENFWKGFVPQGSLSCLKFLSVHTCHKLEVLFTRPLLCCFKNLKELVVEDCAMLKVIIEREEDHEMVVQSRDMLIFPSMTKLNLHYLPELTNIWLGDCPLLKPTGISIRGCPKAAQHSEIASGNSGEIVELNTT